MDKWMSKIPDNKKMVLINIPGSHDSAAYCMNRMLSCFSQTQYFDILQQLEIGVRKLDLRITSNEINRETNEDIICCHGICDCYVAEGLCDQRKLTYKSILIDIKKFLEKNPSETVIVSTFLGRGHFQDIIRSYEIFNQEVGGISIAFHPDLLLGECRGKIIISTFLDNEIQTGKKKMPIVRARSKSLIKGTGIEEIHSRYKGSNVSAFEVCGNTKVSQMKDMFIKYNMTLEEAEIKEIENPKIFPIAYSISCTGENELHLPYPIVQANIVNSFISKEGAFKKGYYYGWINMDFVIVDITSKLAESNFK